MGPIYRELFSPVPSMLSFADNCGRYGISIIGDSFSEISLLQIGIALENITRTRVAAGCQASSKNFGESQCACGLHMYGQTLSTCIS